MKVRACFLLSVCLQNVAICQAKIYLRQQSPTSPIAINYGIECIQRVSGTYFQNDLSVQVPNLAFMDIRNLSSPAREIKEGYLKMLHHQILSDESSVKVQLRVYSIRSRFRFFRSIITPINFYVIVIDDFDDLVESMKYLSKLPAWNPYGKFIILFNNPALVATVETTHMLASRMLELMFVGYHSVNVVVAIGMKIMTYRLYTGDPYHSDTQGACGKMKPILIGTCANGLFDGVSTPASGFLVAPKVPARMESCTFNLCARVAEPFVNPNCLTGLEISVIHIFQRKLGFQINVTCYNSTMERGEIIPTDVGWSHLLGKIRRDECDFIAGAFFPDYEVHLDFGPATLIFQDRYTWFIAVAENRKPWKDLLCIFEEITWLLFAIILGLSSFSWFAFANLLPEPAPVMRNLVMCFLNSWAIFLGVSVHNRPMLVTLRVLFVMLTLYGLNVNTIYTSQLITAFTVPVRGHQIDSIEEILDLDIPIGGRLENMDWFDNENSLDRLIFEGFDTSLAFQPSNETIRSIMRSEKVALMSEKYVLSSKYRNALHGVSKKVLSTSVEIICEKGFPLLLKFNQILSHINDMGILQKFMNDFKFNTTVLKEISEREILDQNETDEVVLTIEHMQSAFIIFTFGILLSTIVVLLECLAASKCAEHYCFKVKEIIWK